MLQDLFVIRLRKRHAQNTIQNEFKLEKGGNPDRRLKYVIECISTEPLNK